MRHERVRHARRHHAGQTPALTRLQRVVGTLQRHFRWIEARVSKPIVELKVHIAQDEESGIWFVARSDIPGLRVEADSADELIRKVVDVAPDLVELNCDEILSDLDVEPTDRKGEEHCRPVIRPIFDTPMAVAVG